MAISRLGGFDAALLYLEFGPQTMNICTLIELDTTDVPGGYSFEGFREHLVRRLDALPELRAKLANTAVNLDNPVWVEDDQFDLDRHLHRIAHPVRGRRELAEVVATHVGSSLDRRWPLWEMWVIEDTADAANGVGTPPGSVAVLLKQHHAIMDGASDTDLMSRLCSTEPSAPHPGWIPGPGPVRTVDIALDGAKRFGRRPLRIATRLVPAFLAAVTNSVRMMVARRTMSSPFTTPWTRFNGAISAHRSVAFVQLDLADIKTVKNALGVKVNDVVLALFAAALRDYLDDLGELPERPLNSLVPIGVEDRDDSGGANQLSAAFCNLQTHLADPVQRLRAIAAASAAAKEHSAALGATLLQDTLQYVTPKLLGWVLRAYSWSRIGTRRPVSNLSVSNVPAAPVQWYLAGARVKAMYGLPPVMHGIGLHAGVSSLNGRLEIGLSACARLMPDAWVIADRLPAALEELMNATG